jgi:hypothetical protein
MDTRFAGILVIIAIVSTAVGSLMFGGVTPVGYSILTNEYPTDPVGKGRFLAIKDTDHLTLSLLVDEPVAMLELSFWYLVETPYEISEVDQVGWDGLSMMEKASRVGLIPSMIELIEFPFNDGIQPEELDVTSGSDKFKLFVYDFSDFIDWAPDPVLGLQVIHGVLFNESGILTNYFVGAPGFMGYGRTLRIVSVSRNYNETRYSIEEKGTQPAGTLPIDESPHLGIIKFPDLKQDEILAVELTMDPSAGLPYNSKANLWLDFMHIVRIELDGELMEVFPILFYTE